MSVYDSGSDAYKEAIESLVNLFSVVPIGFGLAEQLLNTFVDDLEDRRKINAIENLRVQWSNVMGGSIGPKAAKDLVERIQAIFLEAEEAQKVPLPDELRFLLDMFEINNGIDYHSHDNKLVVAVEAAKAKLSELYKF